MGCKKDSKNGTYLKKLHDEISPNANRAVKLKVEFVSVTTKSKGNKRGKYNIIIRVDNTTTYVYSPTQQRFH